jgi:carboxymethylenebutenolidase
VARNPQAQHSNRAIILLQEWWGLNEQIKGLSERFAEHGYTVVAPDLYHGKVAAESSEANHLMAGLDFNAAVNEVSLWIDYLHEQGCQRVGVTGFCMGGALSLAAASKLGDRLQAIVPYYGVPDLGKFPVSSIRAPLQLHFGSEDHSKGFSDPATVERLKQALNEAGKSAEFHVYPGAQHAFMNEQRPEVYDAAVAKKAFQATLAFFDQHLKA